jgi:plasmid stabilization system protein ParE
MSHDPSEVSNAAQEDIEDILKQLIRLFREAALEMCAAAAKTKIRPSAKPGMTLRL